MKRVLIPLGLLVAASSGTASTVGLHLGSSHFGSEQDCVVYVNQEFRKECEDIKYEQFNPGVYYRSAADNGLGYTFGGYENSFSKTSLYAGAYYERYVTKHFTLGGGAALVTGYSDRKETKFGILPSVVFESSFQIGKYGIRASYLPGSIAGGVDVLGFSVEMKLN